MKNNYVVTVVVAIIVGIGAFFVGSHFASSQTPQNAGQGGNRFLTRNGSGTRTFNGTVGTIVSISGNSLTVQTPDGSSKVVFFDPSVQVTKTVPGAVTDLKSGTTVLITGSTNADGSLTAQSIQIRPLGARGQEQNPQTSSGTPSTQ